MSDPPVRTSPLSEQTERSLLAALLAMHEFAVDQPEQEILQQGIEHAVALTGSDIGYLHFVNEDQETIELVTWSERTLALCTAVYDRHYPIPAAGIWADCVRFKRPFMHNDYPSTAQRSGYPEGHPELQRHLSVPVIEQDKVRILIGVGNKPQPYDERDIAILQRIGDATWELVLRRRELEQLLVLQQQMRELQRIASVTSWECDPDEDNIVFDDLFRHILSADRAIPMPLSIEDFLGYIDISNHRQVKELLSSRDTGTHFYLEITGINHAGERLPLAIQGRIQPRPRGESVIINGILQDLSERRAMDEIREKAFHDPLTGLGNRNMLMERIQQGLTGNRRRPTDMFAIHYIDLDRFKSVNDHFGHRIGDEVLQEVARRMRKLIRREDLVVRLGGDEFVVVQNALAHEADASALAEKINRVMDEPCYIEGLTLSIGASIGIVLSRPSDSRDIGQLIDAADEALYRCKASHPGRFVIFKSDTAGIRE
jgi:diguanylate cyclase (GGDEF)-like protein